MVSRSLGIPRRAIPCAQRTYLRKFLRRDWTLILAFNAGLACVAATIGFTTWLSKQILRCPDWATDCAVGDKVDEFRRNIATVQGLVTVTYAIGLAALAFAAHGMSEAALWPLLNRQSLTIKQLDAYLEASRGSITASLSVLLAARGFHSTLIVSCTVVVTLLPFAAAPLTGFVYDQGNIPTKLQSQYQPGGGIGPSFQQNNPPTSIRVGASTLYDSWSSGISKEPMPESWDWFVDRSALATRGNMTVRAVRLKTDISCGASKPEIAKAKGHFVYYKTNMKRGPGEGENDATAKVNLWQRLTVWAHDYTFISPTKTSATLFFAAFNGAIEGGANTTDPGGEGKVANVSTISCNISVEFVEDTLVVGSVSQGLPTTQINFLGRLRGGHGANNNDNENKLVGNQTLNELALWFTMATVAIGKSKDGAQPLYKYEKDGLPMSITSGMNDTDNGRWTINYIENFIRVAMGAIALSESKSWKDGGSVVMTSIVHTKKLNPSRPRLLAIPPMFIIAFGLVMMVWNLRLHASRGLPIMRKAPLSEILKSALTEEMCHVARLKEGRPEQPSRLGGTKIKCGVITEAGNWGFVALSEDKPFEEGDSRELLDVEAVKPKQGSSYASLHSVEYVAND